MNYLRKKLLLILIVLFIILSSWSMMLIASPDKSTAYHYGYNLVYGLPYLLGAVLALHASNKLKTNFLLQRGMLLYGVGLFFWGIGLYTWAFSNFILHVEVPYPSLPDILFAVTYIMLPLAHGNFLTFYLPQINKTQRLWSSGVAFILFIFLFAWFTQLRADENISLLQHVFNLWYSFVDTTLIAWGVVTLWFLRQQKPAGLLLMSLGFIVLGVADIVFLYRTNLGFYWNGDIADLLYAMAGFLFSLSVLYLIKKIGENGNGA